MHHREVTPAFTWQRRLDSAHSEAEIVDAARDFLALFDPFELNALPRACRPPGKIVDADDVAAYAFELVRHECDTDARETDLVHKLARFFAHAATRLSQVNAFRADVGDDAGESRESAQ
jgi:hypothetical protein